MPDLKGKIRRYEYNYCIFLLVLISSTFGVVSIHFAYSQSDQMISNSTNSLDIQNLPAKKARVGDIDIAYKVFGKR
jgi:hypothetical protein